MKRENILLYALALLFCFLSAAVAWAQAGKQPSLADIAKQKPAAKAKRVITNDDIPPSPEANAPAPTPAGSASSSASASGADAAKPDDKKADAKGAAPTEKQTRLQQLMKEQESLQKVIAQLQQQIDSTNDQNRISTLSSVVQHARQELAKNQQEIDKLQAGGAAGPPAAQPAPPK